MRSPYKYFALFSVLVASLYGCTNTDDFQVENVPQYNISVLATKDSGDVETRALFLGGNNGNRFYSLWDKGDQVDVYKSDSFVGNMTPQETGVRSSKLSGVLSGSYAVNDEIDVYLPHPTLDFTGQKGTVGDISASHAFLKSTIKVVEVTDGKVVTEDLKFSSRNCYLHFTFVDEDGIRLHVEQLIISAASGKLVLTKTMEGVTTYGDMVINLEKENGEYPGDVYVSLHNDLSGAKDMYTFTVKAGGYTYCSNASSNSYINAELKDGKSYTADKVLTLQSAASRITTTSSVNDFGAGNGASGEAGSVNF